MVTIADGEFYFHKEKVSRMINDEKTCWGIRLMSLMDGGGGRLSLAENWKRA